MNKVQEAVDCFKEGFSCSQAVFATYAKELGLDYETALKISQAFGGGMVGSMKGECGAVTGAYMVIGLMHGRTRAEDNAAKLKTYELSRKFAECFKARNQSTGCGELLKDHQGSTYEVCEKYVKDACIILEELLHIKEV